MPAKKRKPILASNTNGSISAVLPPVNNSTPLTESSQTPTRQQTSKTVSSPESVSLLTLQTWNLQQLESHAKKFEESNQPIPNVVKILLDDAGHKEEKRHAK
ncbi:hypothetical protein ACHAWO_006436 [Cyclotella atomus]|uniref:Uncharacterized protein n=1 Tax=Cyclotella atomus TaxID=382360 RepID=A0ABD3Q3I3_9STRA